MALTPKTALTAPANLAASIAEAEYAFRQTAGERVGAPNRAQDLRVALVPAGLELESRTQGASALSLGLQLVEAGRAASPDPVLPGRVRADGARAALERGSIEEWVVNAPAGVEHGLRLRDRPPGDGPIRLRFAVSGSLSPRLTTPDEITFVDGAARVALRYHQLVVTDADGVRLPAQLGVAPDGIVIEIDDAGAAWPLSVDPLLTTAWWTVAETQAAADFGRAVGTAGDVNGDGYSDLLVTAPLYDNGHSDEGRVFVFHGGPAGLSSTPAWTAEGDQAGARFGYSATSAGDVNGDGYDDVVVGARTYDAGQSDEGRAFLYLGAPTGLSPSPVWTAESNQASSQFGLAVAGAGDVNNDGYDDVLVGAPYFDDAATDSGRAYLYLGSVSGLAETAAWTGSGTGASSYYGSAVAGAFDLNGDGYAEIAVGAPNFDGTAGADTGRASVYLGGPSGPATTPIWVQSGDQAGAFFGFALAGVGDVDGDGYADLAVGAPTYDAGEVDEGRVYLFRGVPAGLSTTASWVGERNQAGAWFGRSVGSAGDVDGDGYADLAVGASRWDGAGTDEGAAFVFEGSAAGLHAEPDWWLSGGEAQAEFGFSVGSAGDLDSDGYTDLVVGAHLSDAGAANAGRAFVYRGTAGIVASTPAWSIGSGQTGAQLGFSVAMAGDLNGDGFTDVAIGAPSWDGGEIDEGTVWVFYGSRAGLPSTPSWNYESDVGGAQFGSAVDGAGDVDGDGYGDLVVGAKGWSHGQFGEGAAFVFGGSSAGLGSAPAYLHEIDEPGAACGETVAGAGDVNGDGYADVAVGCPEYFTPYGSHGGRVDVVYGSPLGLGLLSPWSRFIPAGDGGPRFGKSLDGAGDVNGDGYGDLIVGIPYDGADFGMAWIFHGSVNGLAQNPAFISYGAICDYKGWSVAGIGDVNGDGYSDIAVGAPNYNEYNPEKVDVYYGAPGGLSYGNFLRLEWWGTKIGFGTSVSGGGDLNGDGFSDLLVATPGNGNFLVYLGSPSGVPSLPSFSVTGGAPGGWFNGGFGVDMSAAGDVDGDGFSDVLVGSAPRWLPSANDSGAAYLYQGNAGRGLDRVPRQLRTDASAPIAPLGRSDLVDAFRLAARGRSPAGRTRVRLRWDVKALSDPFGGTHGAGPWLDTGAPTEMGSVVALDALVSGLPTAPHKWRVRIESGLPVAPASRWLILPDNAVTETDLLVSSNDPDGDGIVSTFDNCSIRPNPDQRDGDADAIGDRCDTPVVLGVVPGGDAVDVPVWADVTITFSEPMDPATITPATLTIEISGTSAPLANTVVGTSADGLRSTLRVIGGLQPLTRYVVLASPGIHDVDAEPLPYSWTAFTTGASTINEQPLGGPGQTGNYQPGEQYGFSTASIEDVNGDGLTDFLVGAPRYDDGGTLDVGRVFLFYGSTDPAERDAPDFFLVGENAGDQLGTAVAGGGDINGDGRPDFIVGAEQPGSGPGRAYVVYQALSCAPGETPPCVVRVADVAGATLVGHGPGDRAGRAVELSRDLNGDGWDDVLVGAPGSDRDGRDRGEVAVLFGGANLDGSPRLSGTIDLRQVAGAGADAIDGFVYLGASAADEYGNFYGSELGVSLSAHADFNGDGRHDVLMGAPFAEPYGNGNWGEVILDTMILGRGVIEVDAVGTPAYPGGSRILGDYGLNFGMSVAMQGDFNGDGYADAVIGAPGATGYESQWEAGETLVIGGHPGNPGSITLEALRDPASGLGVSYLGTTLGDRLGTSVTMQPDSDGDGADELAMGAPGYDGPPAMNAGENRGGVYVAQGALLPFGRGVIEVDRIGDREPGAIYYGEPGDSAGSSMSGLTDVDGDRASDLLVGAPGIGTTAAKAAGNGAGTAFLIFGNGAPVPTESAPIGPEGGELTDLDSGAHLEVPAGSLTSTVQLTIDGILEEVRLPLPPPTGWVLVGASTVDPIPLDYDPPLPLLSIPVRASYADQVPLGYLFDVYVPQGGSWVPAERGWVVSSAGVQSGKFVNVLISSNDTYAVFAHDLDADGVLSFADNCPDAHNPDQDDADRDGWGSACDNCPSRSNGSQHDLDTDGEGDECDLDDGVVLFIDLDRDLCRWQSDPSFTHYNLYRGSLAVLLAGGPYTQEPGSNPYAARFCDLTGTTLADTLLPFAGEAFYWLAAGDGSGGEAPLGAGDSVTRPNTHPCP